MSDLVRIHIVGFLMLRLKFNKYDTDSDINLHCAGWLLISEAVWHGLSTNNRALTEILQMSKKIYSYDF